MPLGPYRDFDDCVAKNRDKDNPQAYCGSLEQQIKGGDMNADTFVDENGDGLDDVTGEPVDMPDDMPEAPMPMIEADGEQAGDDFHALLAVEGVWTGDGRWIEEGALSWRNLPLPLMATDRTTEGHMDAVLIGNLTRIEREGREIHGWGRFVQSDDPTIMRLQDFIRNGDLRGISVDLDAVEYDIVLPAGPITEDVIEEAEDVAEDIEEEMTERRFSADEAKMKVTAARIMGATVVPFPAFEEAFIESLASLCASLAMEARATGYIRVMASYADIDFTPPLGARQEAERGLAWREEFGRGGTAVGVARARDIKNGVNLSPATVNRMASYFARHEVDKEGMGWRPDEDGYPSAGRIAWALWGGDPGWAWARKIQNQMASRDRAGSIIASAHPITAPVVPPSAWFSDPKLAGPTPLTVTDDGRVFGHLATWGSCHVAYADSCVTPPRSQAKYAHFLTGELICDDGVRVPVGQITMDTGHAPLHVNGPQALAHYDNTGTAVIDVTVGEDRFGIWMAGALRPNLDPSVIRAVMAADVSGDWRRIGSGLELVAILSVNVPGFPKNRVAVRETEGMVASLVASLPVFRWAGSESTPIERRAAERIAASIGRDLESRLNQLRNRIHREV